MFKRHLSSFLRQASVEFRVVLLSGPRQSGKTTLVRTVFPKHEYITLENPEARSFAEQDPRGFLDQYAKGVILDEVQQTPILLSYIQTIVDERNLPGQFILTGSQNMLLMNTVTQTLAGRVAVFELLPLSMNELTQKTVSVHQGLFEKVSQQSPIHKKWEEIAWRGMYPALHAQEINVRTWMRSYEKTYIERDVRQILNVGDLASFRRFLHLCAGRVGQLLNVSSLGNDCGISHTTAERWLSLLEASYLITRLQPHHQNFSKRLIKSPKLYFLDTGLLCYLLQIQTPKQLRNHALRGMIFESFIYSEIRKFYSHVGEETPLFFWRDRTGHEVDFMIDTGSGLLPIEVKSGQTVTTDMLRDLEYYRQLAGRRIQQSVLLYGGSERQQRSNGVRVEPWWAVG